MTSPAPRWFAALALTLAAATPAFGMAERPKDAPMPVEAHPASSIADMEEAAGHLLILGPEIVFETTRGKFTIETFPKEAPRTIAQVLELASSGFYDGLAVHRVVPGFAIQVGDPNTKQYPPTDPHVGRGGSGKPLPPEFDGQTVKQLLGTVAMARSVKDPNSADSQFYVTLAPQPHLDGAFTVWGQVVSGMDVIRHMQVGDRIKHVAVVQVVAPSPASPKPGGAKHRTPGDAGGMGFPNGGGGNF